MLSSSGQAPAAGAALGTAPTVGVQTSVSLPGGPADRMMMAPAAKPPQSQLSQPSQPHPHPQPAVGPAAPTGTNVRAGMQTQVHTQIGLSAGLGGGAREVSASSCSSSAGSAASSSSSSSHRSQQPQSAQSAQFQPQSATMSAMSAMAYPNPQPAQHQFQPQSQSQSQSQSQAQQQGSRSPLHTVVTVLTRPSTATPQHRWGLQISLFDGQYLLLGGGRSGHGPKVHGLWAGLRRQPRHRTGLGG